MNLWEQIWFILSGEMSFEPFTSILVCTWYTWYSPMSHMLQELMKTKKKLAKIQNFNHFYNFCNRVSVMYFQSRCCLKFCLRYAWHGPMLTKSQKKKKKIVKNPNILNFGTPPKKFFSRDMVDRYMYLSTTCLRENWFNGCTTDACVMTIHM